MADDSERNEIDVTDHLDGVLDGSGCTEIWEHLSEDRNEDDDTEAQTHRDEPPNALSRYHTT